MEPSKHRTWPEVDLGAIEHNYRVICAQAKSPVLCVVEADAYGHGAVQIATRLQEIGAPYFAAATVPEAGGAARKRYPQANFDSGICR